MEFGTRNMHLQLKRPYYVFGNSGIIQILLLNIDVKRYYLHVIFVRDNGCLIVACRMVQQLCR